MEKSNLQLIRPDELSKILRVSKMTIWRLSKKGELPPKIKISGRAVGWLKSDIENFIQSRKETVAQIKE